MSIQKIDVNCLQVQLANLHEKFGKEALKTEQLEKTVAEMKLSKKQENRHSSLAKENELLKTQNLELKLNNEHLKKLNVEKLNPKLTQTLLNAINDKSSRLYFHLYIPYCEKYREKIDEKYVMWKTLEKWYWMNLCGKSFRDNEIKFKVQLTTFTMSKKRKTDLQIFAGASKLTSGYLGGNIYKISLGGPDNGKEVMSIPRLVNGYLSFDGLLKSCTSNSFELL